MLQLSYTTNQGAFLSIGENLSRNLRIGILVLGVAGIVIAAAKYVWSNSLTRRQTLAYSLIVAGGLGNLIDRMVFDGQVRDFLNVGIGSVRTGIFNVADMLITTAVLGFLVSFTVFRKAGVEASVRESGQ